MFDVQQLPDITYRIRPDSKSLDAHYFKGEPGYFNSIWAVTKAVVSSLPEAAITGVGPAIAWILLSSDDNVSVKISAGALAFFCTLTGWYFKHYFVGNRHLISVYGDDKKQIESPNKNAVPSIVIGLIWSAVEAADGAIAGYFASGILGAMLLGSLQFFKTLHYDFFQYWNGLMTVDARIKPLPDTFMKEYYKRTGFITAFLREIYPAGAGTLHSLKLAQVAWMIHNAYPCLPVDIILGIAMVVLIPPVFLAGSGLTYAYEITNGLKMINQSLPEDKAFPITPYTTRANYPILRGPLCAIFRCINGIAGYQLYKKFGLKDKSISRVNLFANGLFGQSMLYGNTIQQSLILNLLPKLKVHLSSGIEISLILGGYAIGIFAACGITQAKNPAFLKNMKEAISDLDNYYQIEETIEERDSSLLM